MRHLFTAIVLACLCAPGAEAGVAALAVDPKTPTTIYAGTAYPDVPPIGVYKSTDGGATWSATSLTDVSVNALVVDPTSAGTLYAGTGDGVYESTDDGDTWSLIGSWSGVVLDLTLDPSTSPATLCATVVFFVGAAHYENVGGSGPWNVVDACPHPGEPPGTTPLYATWAPQGTDGGVYKSTNAGSTWLARNVGLADAKVLVLAVDPTTRATVYAGTEHGGVFKSTDGACTWSGVGLADTATAPRARPVCQDGADAIGLVCRLDVLSDFVRVLLPNGDGPDARVLAWSEAARRQILDVAEPPGVSESMANALLRRARRELTAFRHVVHRVGRHRLTVPLPDMVDGVLVDLRALREVDPADRVCH